MSKTHLLLLTLVAPSLFGAVPARESCFPVAGRWRGSSSTLVLTNTASRPTRLTLSWIVGSPREMSPPHIELMLHGNETRTLDVGQELLRGKEAAGAIRIAADADVIGQAVVRGRVGGPSAAFDAIPIRDAIGTGESTVVAGMAGGGGYRLFVAETKGHPIYFSATVFAGDETRGERRYYVEPLHQLTVPIDREFKLQAGEPFTIIIRAMNGSGRLIAAGAELTAQQDLVAFEMLLPTRPRHRIGSGEIVAYAFVAIALITSAIYRRKSRV